VTRTIPAKGTHPPWASTVRRCPADSVPPVEHRSCGRRPGAPPGCQFGQGASEFQDTTRERRQLRRFSWKIDVLPVEWRRGVGRQAR
jgi:hypothetical protein